MLTGGDMTIETLGQTLIPVINKLQDLFSQVKWKFANETELEIVAEIVMISAESIQLVMYL